MPVPQNLEETVEVVRLVPRKRVQQPNVEEDVDVVRLLPQERVQWIDEQMVGVPTPQKFGGQ